MLAHYTEICWMCLAVWMGLGDQFKPWVSYVAAAFIFVLSMIKAIG